MDPWASFLNWNANALNSDGNRVFNLAPEEAGRDESHERDKVESLELEAVGSFPDFTGGFRLASTFINLKHLSLSPPKHGLFIQWPLRPEILPPTITSLSLTFGGAIDVLLFLLDLNTSAPTLRKLSIVDNHLNPFASRDLSHAIYPLNLCSLSITASYASAISHPIINNGAIAALPRTLETLEIKTVAGHVDALANWPPTLQHLILGHKAIIDLEALPPTLRHFEASFSRDNNPSTFDWTSKLPHLEALISPNFDPSQLFLDAEMVTNLPSSLRKLTLRSLVLPMDPPTSAQDLLMPRDPKLSAEAQSFLNALEELSLTLSPPSNAWKFFPALKSLRLPALLVPTLPPSLTTLDITAKLESVSHLPSTLTQLNLAGGFTLSLAKDDSSVKFEQLPSLLKTLRIGSGFTIEHAAALPTNLEYLSITLDDPSQDGQHLWDSLNALPKLTSLGMTNSSSSRPSAAKIPSTLKTLSFFTEQEIPLEWWQLQLPQASSLETLMVLVVPISPALMLSLPPSLTHFTTPFINALPETSHFAALPRSLRSLELRQLKPQSEEAKAAILQFQGYSAETLRALPPLSTLKLPWLHEFIDVHLPFLPQTLHDFGIEDEVAPMYYSNICTNLLHPHCLRVMDALGWREPDQDSYQVNSDDES